MHTMISNTRSKITLGSPKTGTSTTFTSPATDADLEPFPFNRTIRWTPRAASTASPAVQFVVTQEVLVAVCTHVAGDLSREFGGFLLGNRYVCPQTSCEYVLIDNYYPAGFTEGDAISLLFSTDTWADLTDKLCTRFRGKLLVGWYHSHPRMDIFLSDDDVEVHRSRFPEEWTCALVLEPEKGLGGFFSYNHGRLNRTAPVEFYEYREHLSEETVIAWANYAREGEEETIKPELLEAAEVAASPEPAAPIVSAEINRGISGEIELPRQTVATIVQPIITYPTPTYTSAPPRWKSMTAGLVLTLMMTASVCFWLGVGDAMKEPLPAKIADGGYRTPVPISSPSLAPVTGQQQTEREPEMLDKREESEASNHPSDHDKGTTEKKSPGGREKKGDSQKTAQAKHTGQAAPPQAEKQGSDQQQRPIAKPTATPAEPPPDVRPGNPRLAPGSAPPVLNAPDRKLTSGSGDPTPPPPKSQA